MSSRLDLIEKRLQAFIETTINPFPASPMGRLSQYLVEAMENSLIQQPGGGLSVSPTYTIALSPVDYVAWQNHSEWLNGLVQVLGQAAWDEGLAFESSLRLYLVSNAALQPGTVQVQSTGINAPSVGQTGIMPALSNLQKETTDPRPRNAFLILENGRIIPLQQVTVNLGRRLDNHIVLEDPRVSRNHAQLRAAHHAYTLFDLNSTGGTFVNGMRISQLTLRPGDVISLAGITLIYGEESGEEPPVSGDDTSTYPTHKSGK